MCLSECSTRMIKSDRKYICGRLQSLEAAFNSLMVCFQCKKNFRNEASHLGAFKRIAREYHARRVIGVQRGLISSIKGTEVELRIKITLARDRFASPRTAKSTPARKML